MSSRHLLSLSRRPPPQRSYLQLVNVHARQRNHDCAQNSTVAAPTPWPHTIYSSALLTSHKSVFQAHASRFSLFPPPTSSSRGERWSKIPIKDDSRAVDMPKAELRVDDQLDCLFAQIQSLHPRTRRATHRMWAYRCLGPPAAPSKALQSDSNRARGSQADPVQRTHVTASFSDVEHASGPILERLLALNDRHSDVIVCVYRWYGGVKLGGERWRCIGGVASEALRLLEAGEQLRGKGEPGASSNSGKRSQTRRRP